MVKKRDEAAWAEYGFVYAQKNGKDGAQCTRCNRIFSKHSFDFFEKHRYLLFLYRLKCTHAFLILFPSSITIFMPNFKCKNVPTMGTPKRTSALKFHKLSTIINFELLG